MCAAAIESGHQADGLRIAWPAGGRLRERNHDALEIARTDGNVGVVDEQELVLRVGNELRESADFAVGAEALGALDQANGASGNSRCSC